MAAIPCEAWSTERWSEGRPAEMSSRSPSVAKPEADAVILDGAVIVQMLKPTTVCTFDEYFTIVFATYVLRHFEAAKRVDLVWDVYKDDSLNKSIREKRGPVKGGKC